MKHLRGVDTHLIVALHALLHARNVTRAAKTMGLSQSSMSHALARLRRQFGDPLLVPSGRLMVLTPVAEALIDPVDLAIARLDDVFAPRATFDPGRTTRTFHLAATDNLEFYLLPALMAKIAREAPGVALRVHHLASDWPAALARGELDLKLGRKYRLGTGLHAEDLFDERLVCAMRRGHPAARGTLTAARFAELRHVVVDPGAGGTPMVDRMLEARGLARRIVLTVSHFLVAPHVVAHSDLVLTASARLLRPFAQAVGLDIVPLPVRVPSYTLTQVWSERSHHDEAHRWLRGLVRAAHLVDDPS